MVVANESEAPQGVLWRGELARGSDARFLLVPGAYWRRDRYEVSASYPERSAGLRGSVGRRKRRPMAQQKSEDRVVPDGGVMPVQLSGGDACEQGKAVPVEQTAVLSVATCSGPNAPASRRGSFIYLRIPLWSPQALRLIGQRYLSGHLPHDQR
ncbi:MAG: hypothetical protein LC808_08450, partial [Actinobacteria bacterium]|nr:hypothetical protein [Actinomycetota bacterium]